MENDKVLLFYPMSFPSCHQKEFPFQVLKKKKKKQLHLDCAEKRVCLCSIDLDNTIPRKERTFFFIKKKLLTSNNTAVPENLYIKVTLFSSLCFIHSYLSLSQTPQLHSFIWPLFLHFLFVQLQNFQYPLHQNVQPTSQIPEPINHPPSQERPGQTQNIQGRCKRSYLLWNWD